MGSMQRKIRNLATIFLLTLGACGAQAQSHPGIDEYMATADRFERLAATSPRPLRLTDPVAGPLLRRLADSRATLGNDRYSGDDLRSLDALMHRSHRIAALYANRGITPNMPPAEVDRRESENTLEFQDEITPQLGFVTDVWARFLQVFLVENVRGEPEAQSARGRPMLLDMRQGDEELFGAMVETAAAPAFRLPNRIAIVEALARNAPVLSAALSLAARRRLRARLQPLRSQFSPSVQSRIDDILERLESAACEGLCAV